MTTQNKVNNRQERTNDRQSVINEDTRVDLKVNNIYAIFVSVIISTVSLIMFVYRPQMELSAKVDMMNQKLDYWIERGNTNTNSIIELQKLHAETRHLIDVCCH